MDRIWVRPGARRGVSSCPLFGEMAVWSGTACGGAAALTADAGDAWPYSWATITKPERHADAAFLDFFELRFVALAHYEHAHDQFLSEVRRCSFTLWLYCAFFRRLKLNMKNRFHTLLSI